MVLFVPAAFFFPFFFPYIFFHIINFRTLAKAHFFPQKIVLKAVVQGMCVSILQCKILPHVMYCMQLSLRNLQPICK